MVWYIASRAVLYQDVGVSKMKISLLSGLELAFFMISGFVTTLLMLPFWSGFDDVLDKNAQIALFIIMLLVSVALVHPRFLQQIWALTARSLPAEELHWKDTVFGRSCMCSPGSLAAWCSSVSSTSLQPDAGHSTHGGDRHLVAIGGPFH